MMNFNLYSKYYDLLYTNKDYESESNYILNILKNYSNYQITSILELGGGTGKHAHYFTKSDIDVFGVELSSSMVEIAEGLNLDRYQVKQGDIRQNHYDGHQFDCAVSLFHVISYLQTNDDVIACFNSVNQQLKPGGLFVFDVWFTPAVYSLKPETRVKKIGDIEYSIVRLAESSVNATFNIVDVNYTIFIKQNKTGEINEINELHSMRHFSYNEMLLICELTGFELVKSEEFITGAEPSVDTWGVLFVLKKTN